MFTTDYITDYLLERATTPLALANSIVILPTRRAVKSLQTILLQRNGATTLLPHIYNITESNTDLLPKPFLRPKPIYNTLQREISMRSVLEQQGHSTQHNNLTESILELIDTLQSHNLDSDCLDKLEVSGFSEHWQQTKQMLQTILAQWQQVKSNELLEPIEGIQQFYDALTTQIEDYAYPVIAAGILNTAPYCLDILETINSLEQGAVLMAECLDTECVIAEFHSDYKTRQIQQHLSLDQDNNCHWLAGLYNPKTDKNAATQHIYKDTLESQHEQAKVIAVKMRRSLEKADQTVALITADRTLAQLVQQQLARWNLVANDSAGLPLSQTSAGNLLQLIIAAIDEPEQFLALLKHPLITGKTKTLITIEKSLFRGRQLYGNIKSIADRCPDYDEANQAARQYLQQIAKNFETLLEALESKQIHTIAVAHQDLANNLTDQKIWKGEDGKTALKLFDNLINIDGQTDDYKALFNTVIKKYNTTPIWNAHNRLHIWGMFEAALQQVDVVILGGLNEGIFPSKTSPNPWLNKAMQKSLGLISTEENTGLAAQLYCSLLQYPEVHLTRAEKVDGKPQLPSPFLEKLETLLQGQNLTLKQDTEAVSIARQLTETPPIFSTSQESIPPQATRPTEISVTDINLLNKDPYAYYAKKILNLKPLDAIGSPSLAAEKGTILHKVLEEFLTEYLQTTPDNALSLLQENIDQALKRFAYIPMQQLFWKQQFYNVAKWFIDNEHNQRSQGRRTKYVEQSVTFKTGPVTIKAKADRLDHDNTSTNIIDYKTGYSPTKSAIESGQELQLLIEALMGRQNAFGPLPTIETIEYWELKGKNQNKINKVDVTDDLLDQVDQYLDALFRYYIEQESGYIKTGVSIEYQHLSSL